MTTYGQSAFTQAWYEISNETEKTPLLNSDLNDKTERTVCSTQCVECGKMVDWPNAHLIYPLCPDCDCVDTLPPSSHNPSTAPEAIQPASIVTLVPGPQ
jgi:hypothetical protein